MNTDLHVDHSGPERREGARRFERRRGDGNDRRASVILTAPAPAAAPPRYTEEVASLRDALEQERARRMKAQAGMDRLARLIVVEAARTKAALSEKRDAEQKARMLGAQLMQSLQAHPVSRPPSRWKRMRYAARRMVHLP